MNIVFRWIAHRRFNWVDLLFICTFTLIVERYNLYVGLGYLVLGSLVSVLMERLAYGQR